MQSSKLKTQVRIAVGLCTFQTLHFTLVSRTLHFFLKFAEQVKGGKKN